MDWCSCCTSRKKASRRQHYLDRRSEGGALTVRTRRTRLQDLRNQQDAEQRELEAAPSTEEAVPKVRREQLERERQAVLAQVQTGLLLQIQIMATALTFPGLKDHELDTSLGRLRVNTTDFQLHDWLITSENIDAIVMTGNSPGLRRVVVELVGIHAVLKELQFEAEQLAIPRIKQTGVFLGSVHNLCAWVEAIVQMEENGQVTIQSTTVEVEVEEVDVQVQGSSLAGFVNLLLDIFRAKLIVTIEQKLQANIEGMVMQIVPPWGTALAAVATPNS